MRLFFSILMFVGFYAGAVQAQSIAEDVERAINLSGQQDPSDSIAAMRNATAELWLTNQLGFSQALFVTDAVNIYGGFDPRGSNVFAEAELIKVYAEPIGYGWRLQNGIYATDLTVNAAVLTDSDEVLWSQDEFGKFDLSSRHRFMEYMLNLELDITGLPKGHYQLRYTVLDAVRDTSAELNLPFSVE